MQGRVRQGKGGSAGVKCMEAGKGGGVNTNNCWFKVNPHLSLAAQLTRKVEGITNQAVDGGGRGGGVVVSLVLLAPPYRCQWPNTS